MHVNAKRYPLKLFHESGERWIKGRGGGSEYKYDIVDILRTFVNATMYPFPAQQ
jgi:hypothetical protein